MRYSPGLAENLTAVQRSASGQRVLYWILGIGFVCGPGSSMSADSCSRTGGDYGASAGGGRPAVHARLGTVDRCRRGRVRPDLSGGKKASVPAGPRCLRGGGRPSGPGRKRQVPDPATEEAVARYRERAEVNPGRYRPSPRPVADQPRRPARGAGPPGRGAIGQRGSRRHPPGAGRGEPGQKTSDLAGSVASLAVMFAGLGRLAEALSASAEAVALYRELAEVNPGT